MHPIRHFFATGLWQRPRRPSTPAVPDAGLLAADPLRPRATGGTEPSAARAQRLRPRAERPLCDRDLTRPPGRGAFMRVRLALFVLCVLMLVVVPVLVVRL